MKTKGGMLYSFLLGPRVCCCGNCTHMMSLPCFLVTLSSGPRERGEALVEV